MRRALFLSVLLTLSFSAVTYAQSGCCSHHGGVCGCSCCDGTPLSNLCSCGGSGSSKPTAPSLFLATAPSSTQVSLSWIDNSSNEDSFRIDRRSESQTLYEEVLSVGANTTSAIINGLTPDTFYYFRIRAHNSAGDSGFTTTTIRTPAPVTLCTDSSPCFAGNRFKVEARWLTRDGTSGNANVVRLTPDSGYLWFFSAANLEAVFKVIDACSSRGYFWFFAGGLTNVQVAITVTDTLTSRMKTYTNPQGAAFQPIQDNQAFACQ